MSLTKADYQDSVLVFDNEPRNKEICRRIEKAIDAGEKGLSMAESNPFKDINDIQYWWLYQRKIITQINQNTYQSVEAKLKVRKMEKNKCILTIFPHLTKNLFTFQDTQDGCTKREKTRDVGRNCK